MRSQITDVRMLTLLPLKFCLGQERGVWTRLSVFSNAFSLVITILMNGERPCKKARCLSRGIEAF